MPERTSGRNGFEFEVEGDEVVIYDVPCFDEHIDSARPAPFDRIDSSRLRQIAAHTQWQERVGRFPRLITPHTGGSPDGELLIFGRAENCQVKHSPELDRDVIYLDWRVDRGFFEAQLAEGKFPGRSVEIELPNDDEPTNGFFISNIAVLRAEAPARPLKDMGRFQRYQRDRRSRAVRISRFQEEPAVIQISEERLRTIVREATAQGYARAQSVAPADTIDELARGMVKGTANYAMLENTARRYQRENPGIAYWRATEEVARQAREQAIYQRRPNLGWSRPAASGCQCAACRRQRGEN